MSRIVVAGYYGFHNLGDEAVLAATCAELRRLRPDAAITALSAAPEETERVHGVRAVPRMRPRAVAAALRGCDLFLCGGGSLFQDATSWRSPWYYLALLGAARRLARRTVVHAQGIEPPRRRGVRAGVAFCLDRVDLVTVRDETSQRVLADLGVRRPRIALVADPSLLLSPDPSARVEAERARRGPGPWFGLALRPWGDGRAARAAAAAARVLADRHAVRWALLPFHPPGDMAVAEAAAAEIGPAAQVVRAPLGAREMLALVGGLDLLVGMRLHALLFAAAQGVPAVAVAYDRKVAALATDLGEPAPLDADAVRSDDLVAAVEAAVSNRAGRRARLLDAVARLRARAAAAPALAAELLG